MSLKRPLHPSDHFNRCLRLSSVLLDFLQSIQLEMDGLLQEESTVGKNYHHPPRFSRQYNNCHLHGLMKTTAHSRAYLSLFLQDHFFPYGILYSSSLYKTDHKLQAIWSWFRKKGQESKLGQPQLQLHTFQLQQLLRMHPRPRGRHEENHHLHLFSVSKLPISQ